jgi:hypothetical protein
MLSVIIPRVIIPSVVPIVFTPSVALQVVVLLCVLIVNVVAPSLVKCRNACKLFHSNCYIDQVKASLYVRF